MPRKYVVVLIGLLAALALTAGAMAWAGSTSKNPMPAKYRYTGWLAPSGTWPSHILVQGDGISFLFADRWNLTHSPVTYRICVVKTGGSARLCKSAEAPASTRPSTVHFGLTVCGKNYVARWYVASREVASWPFRYLCEKN
jgi:hypothetical protein